mmetsp:Transcript_14641/g.40698  ORF Transcript_14641/g.40698 Transcript_14641/m.40698 type:complete len:339 (-) Transcript_14641:194-1210(-)
MVMVTQNISIEGAYQEAIEDAANRIHEASRPTQAADTSRNKIVKRGKHCPSSTDSVLCHGIIPGMKPSDKTLDEVDCVKFASLSNGDILRQSITLDDRYSTDFSNIDDCTDDDGLESEINFLEEKKRILKMAPVLRQTEEAYIAVNAHDIANGMESSFRRTRNPSLWVEARAVIEQHKILGGRVGTNEEDDEVFDSISPWTTDTERQKSKDNYCSHSSRPSPPTLPEPESGVVNDVSPIPTKRHKIDISMVERISAEKFAGKEHLNTSKEDDEEKSMSAKCLNRLHNCISPTTRCQEASKILSATDSSHWISPTVLNRILNLSNAVVTEHLQRERVQK